MYGVHKKKKKKAFPPVRFGCVLGLGFLPGRTFAQVVVHSRERGEHLPPRVPRRMREITALSA